MELSFLEYIKSFYWSVTGAKKFRVRYKSGRLGKAMPYIVADKYAQFYDGVVMVDFSKRIPSLK